MILIKDNLKQSKDCGGISNTEGGLFYVLADPPKSPFYTEDCETFRTPLVKRGRGDLPQYRECPDCLPWIPDWARLSPTTELRKGLKQPLLG